MTALLSFAGGIGLFLLGMRLLTDGLKLAAGDSPRQLLGDWISSPLRGLLAGALLTAAAQSSSAVVSATLGFVNAGLLSLTQAIGVFHGSSLGATVTGWLVAGLGFNLQLEPLALPAIAIGALLRINGSATRRALVGDLLTGLGVFLLGIEVLKTTFAEGDAAAVAASFDINNWGALLGLLVLGAVLSAVLQSTCAALAAVLAAVAGGMIPLAAGAALIIGANVGAASTALLAAIGATAAAKRAATAYIVCTVVAGLLAFALLPALLPVLRLVGETLNLSGQPALLLALFHALINLIGLAALYPFTWRLARFLEARFRAAAEDESRPQHLDHNAAATPVAALQALRLELARIGRIAHRAVQGVLAEPNRDADHLARDQQTVEALTHAMADFVAKLQRRAAIPPHVAEALPQVLRISQCYDDMTRRALEVANLRAALPPPVSDPALAESLAQLRSTAERLLRSTNPEGDSFHPGYYEPLLQQAQTEYQSLKDLLLRTGSQGGLPVEHMAARLDQLGCLHRALEQAVKAARRVQALTAAQ